MLEPHWDRSCADCIRWEFDDEEDSPPGRRGLPVLDDDGRTPVPRGGNPPCRRCLKVPAATRIAKQKSGDRVTPDDAIEPGYAHRLAVEHFLECEAVRQFPDDGWVRRHAALIRPLLHLVENRPIREMNDLLLDFIQEVRRNG